jgi:hypothetical protein
MCNWVGQKNGYNVRVGQKKMINVGGAKS